MFKFARHVIVTVSLLCAFCASSSEEVNSEKWLRASVLDLRYKSSEFDESRILVVGYLPSDKIGNFLWLYATQDAAISRDEGFGIPMIAATDEHEMIRNQCGSGRVHIVGYFVSDHSPSGGIIAVEQITQLDDDSGVEGLAACWSLD